MAVKYVSADTTISYRQATGGAKKLHLLWGDRVDVIEDNGGARVKGRARWDRDGGWIPRADLGDTALLEVYLIDVGQGDGVLICTPERKHILIDGGYKRSKQPTGKNAADFVDWKFAKDYDMDHIKLEAIIASHNDADHYGGLWDLINPAESDELDLKDVRVDALYHAGVGWWYRKKENGKWTDRWLGEKAEADGDKYLTWLMDDRSSAVSGLAGTGKRKLQGEWADFIQCVVNMPQTKIKRLSHVSGFVPGFGPGQSQATLKVLGPVEYELGGKPVLRSHGSDSKNTNGNSLLLRLDYGRTRILLTGDLNKQSQQLLLTEYTGDRAEFACDVTKGCHHGSKDVSYQFLSALQPSATVISSGDCEQHAHPQPSIVAASAITGNVKVDNDELVTPLIYSTEISRSYRIGDPYEIAADDYETGSETVNVLLKDADNPLFRYTETSAGDLNPKKRTRRMAGLYIVSGVIYGLVNVRTDGNRILCATLNEKDGTWDYSTFESRF